MSNVKKTVKNRSKTKMIMTSHLLVVEISLKTLQQTFHLMAKQLNAAQQILKVDGSEKVNISMCLHMVLKQPVIRMDGF